MLHGFARHRHCCRRKLLPGNDGKQRSACGYAARLIHACQFIFHLQEIRRFIYSPGSPHGARRASSAPRPAKREHCCFLPVMVSPQRGRIALRFLPRGIRDLEQPGKAPSCPHPTPSRALLSRRWPGTMPGSCSLSASAGQIRTAYRGTTLFPSPDCTGVSV